MHFLDPLFLIKAVGLIGVLAIIFIESGIFFGFFFPGDSLLFTAGLLASRGFLSFPMLILGTASAATLGGLVGYAFGKQVGNALFSREDSLFFNKKHLLQTQAYYEKHGKMTLILGRFLPIVRTFVPIIAGIGSMDFKTFFVYNLTGAVMWSVLLCAMGYYLGEVLPNAEEYILPIIVAIIILSFLPAVFKFIRRPSA